MEAAAQQFHLKWNNHSLNTLSSFQHLLDTNTLVDVSLTCSNGKTVTAHRMVLAACSDYFYRLFKDLPEKHPVIVFKDAGEEIVRDLLLFMYKGEVEVQESYLNDFLKFADTLQVKGLSQNDREDASGKAAAAAHAAHAAAVNAAAKLASAPESPIKSMTPHNIPVSMSSLPTVLPHMTPHTGLPTAPMPADMAKSYLAAAGLGKFPPMFPHLPNEPASAAELLSSLSSPNLYRALQRKYQNQLNPKFNDMDNPMLKQMPFLKAAADLAAFYPQPPSMDNDNDSCHSDSRPLPASPPTSNAGTRSATPLAACATPGSMRGPLDDENGHHSDSAMDTTEGARPTGNSSGADSAKEDDCGASITGSTHTTTTTRPSNRGRGKSARDQLAAQHDGGGRILPTGRGSRLERMIAAEYKIMSEFQDTSPPEVLPVMTPELMKSRRTHSLQLAIGEILHSRASVQSAATKYHIPRETLRRHYQRYLKAMGIQKPPQPGGGGGGNGNGNATATSSAAASPVSTTTVRSSVPTNNNAKGPLSLGAPVSEGGDEPAGPNGGFSSLLDIGQAYGIWGSDIDSSDFKSKLKDEAVRRAMTAAAAMAQVGAMHHGLSAQDLSGGGEKDNKQLIIDEDDDDEIIEPGDDSEPPPMAVVVDKKESMSADDDEELLEVADDNDNSKKSIGGVVKALETTA